MEEEEVWVVFPPGPVGLQLDADEGFGSRVVRFVDGGPHKPGPARATGKIAPGDWVTEVTLGDDDHPSARDYQGILGLLQKSHLERRVRVRSFAAHLHHLAIRAAAESEPQSGAAAPACATQQPQPQQTEEGKGGEGEEGGDNPEPVGRLYVDTVGEGSCTAIAEGNSKSDGAAQQQQPEEEEEGADAPEPTVAPMNADFIGEHSSPLRPVQKEDLSPPATITDDQSPWLLENSISERRHCLAGGHPPTAWLVELPRRVAPPIRNRRSPCFGTSPPPHARWEPPLPWTATAVAMSPIERADSAPQTPPQEGGSTSVMSTVASDDDLVSRSPSVPMIHSSSIISLPDNPGETPIHAIELPKRTKFHRNRRRNRLATFVASPLPPSAWRLDLEETQLLVLAQRTCGYPEEATGASSSSSDTTTVTAASIARKEEEETALAGSPPSWSSMCLARVVRDAEASTLGSFPEAISLRGSSRSRVAVVPSDGPKFPPCIFPQKKERSCSGSGNGDDGNDIHSATIPAKSTTAPLHREEPVPGSTSRLVAIGAAADKPPSSSKEDTTDKLSTNTTPEQHLIVVADEQVSSTNDGEGGSEATTTMDSYSSQETTTNETTFLKKAKAKHQLSMARLRVKKQFANSKNTIKNKEELNTLAGAVFEAKPELVDATVPSNVTLPTSDATATTSSYHSTSVKEASTVTRSILASETESAAVTSTPSPFETPEKRDRGPRQVPGSAIDFSQYSKEQSVVFEPGPVGMQLAQESLDSEYPAKIIRFVDGGPQDPGQARDSGRLRPGDFVVRVESEGIVGTTYYTILHLLQKTWARRKLIFRSAWDPNRFVPSATIALASVVETEQPSTIRTPVRKLALLKEERPLPFDWTPLPYDWIHKPSPTPKTPEQRQAMQASYREEARRLFREREDHKQHLLDKEKRRRELEDLRIKQASSAWNFEDILLGAVAVTAETVVGCLRKETGEESDDEYFDDAPEHHFDDTAQYHEKAD